MNGFRVRSALENSSITTNRSNRVWYVIYMKIKSNTQNKLLTTNGYKTHRAHTWWLSKPEFFIQRLIIMKNCVPYVRVCFIVRIEAVGRFNCSLEAISRKKAKVILFLSAISIERRLPYYNNNENTAYHMCFCMIVM